MITLRSKSGHKWIEDKKSNFKKKKLENVRLSFKTMKIIRQNNNKTNQDV